MKRNEFFSKSHHFKSILFLIRIFVLGCIFGLTSLKASTYSQMTELSLNMKGVTILDVFSQIESQTEFVFIYMNETIDLNKKINVNVNKVTVDKLLDKILKNLDLSYKINDRQIIVLKDQAKLKKGQAEPMTPVDNTTELMQPQRRVVKGTVTDVNGDGLVGVNIVVKGTTIGAITDINGNYSFEIPDDSRVLVFSFIGMETQEIALSALDTYNVTLLESLTGLEELVVVGYTTQQRKSLTSAISSIRGEELSVDVSSNPITKLQGKVSGVTIVNSHTPGGGAEVRIRGLSTINSNSPLFIVDGVPTGAGGLNSDEIESISILKDATATAIYGARGANGVVIVTTKRGEANKQRVSLSTRYGFSNFKNPFQMLNPKEMGEFLWLVAQNKGIAPISPLYGDGATPRIPDYIVPTGAMEGDPGTDPSLYDYTRDNFHNITKANKKGTDWYDEILNHNAMTSETNLAISGGSTNSTYAVNFGYMKQDGIVKWTSYDRYTIRANSDMRITDWLKIGESLGAYISKRSGEMGDGHEWTPIGYANTMWAIIPLKDIQGNWAGNKGVGGGSQNPVAMAYRGRNNWSKDLSLIGNLYADVQLLKNLKFRSLFGYSLYNGNNRRLYLQSPEAQEPNFSDALDQGTSTNTQWNWANTLDYAQVIGRHTLNILAGTEAISNEYRGFSASRTNFYLPTDIYMELDTGTDDISNDGNSSASSTASYFGRLNYGYADKYLLEFTFRRDGSSRFGPDSRWGNFPSLSVGWVVTEESFMENIKNTINFLKFRAGYGLTGNDRIGNYNGFSIYSTNIYASYYPIDGSYNSTQAGFYKSDEGNTYAKWETTATTNVGIEFGVLNNTLTAILDIWNRKTSDMLFAKQIPAVVGGAWPPDVNIGEMENKGFDLTLNYNNVALRGDLRYDLSLVASRYKNKIISISDSPEEYIEGTAFRYQVYTRAMAGTAYPEFYGLTVDGIFQTQAEADAHAPIFGGAYNIPGHFKFRDISGPDGKPDGVVDAYDNTFIGSPHPKFTAGFDWNVSYKAFTLSGFLYSSYGNKIADYTARWRHYGIFGSNRSTDALYKSWGSPHLKNNADATLPMMDDDDIHVYPSTAHLKDGSYLRLKTLQLSYNLPSSIVNKLTARNLTVYVQGTNLFTITKYDGWDPEVITSGIDMGVETGQWPTLKSVMFGLKLDL